MFDCLRVFIRQCPAAQLGIPDPKLSSQVPDLAQILLGMQLRFKIILIMQCGARQL